MMRLQEALIGAGVADPATQQSTKANRRERRRAAALEQKRQMETNPHLCAAGCGRYRMDDSEYCGGYDCYGPWKGGSGQ
jgi:hypothetical protein